MNVYSSPDFPQYIFVGSIPSDTESLDNAQRVKIELFGGNYEEGSQSRTIYVVDSRYGCRISKEMTSGITTGTHKLRIFQRDNMYDIVIEVFGWGGYNIKSTFLGYDIYSSDFKCEYYDISGKKDVTSNFITTILTVSDKNGNVGIGIMNPSCKLDVAGTIRSKEVKIESTGWADFVFKEEYKLPSLQSIEKHINQKGTLPDIPSEHEVKENGLNLGEMQIKLLQKIEELTLYTIQQQKQIDNQQQLLEEHKINLQKQAKLIEQLLEKQE